MTKNTTIDVASVLKQAPVMTPDIEQFDQIMDQLHHAKKKQQWWLPMAAMFVLFVSVWMLLPPLVTESNKTTVNDQMAQLIKKVNLIELAVLSQSVKHSEPGSDILEKMVSIENWLVQLNTNIAQSTDEQQTLALLNAKLEVLDDLAALQKKLMPPIETSQPLI
ncbi:hypothetical protein [Marinicella rhabdoformis]|uniref:hypothetical protein n=1 Tax=Marinicella rhabdoformis TaxID=2580566 RepID=UPI0012AEC538|nr:hypothetical protein [Marinicella rhabdoformis]